jgi:hypothetical protein
VAGEEKLKEVNLAGRLKFYIKEWEAITNDETILQAVRGFRLPFTSVPFQTKEPHCIRMSESDALAVDECIGQLLITQAIEIVKDEPGQFVSTIFVVPKSDGSSRPVINLKSLNEFVDSPHFKMEDIRTAISLLGKNFFLAVLDVKDAYHMIPVHTDHRKYLRFRWKGHLYQYTCLPFGLNVAPRLYTKLMKPVLASLRSKGYKSVSYLDDCLCIGDTEKICLKNTKSTAGLYKNLGITINTKKSQLIPSQKVRYLGFEIDTQAMLLYLPIDKRSRVLSKCKCIREKISIKIIELAELLGTLVSACPAVPYGPLYTRTLEYDKSSALMLHHGNFEASMTISQEGSEDLDWWITNLPTAAMPIETRRYEFQLTTDASLTGWGAEMNGQSARDFWTACEKSQHINVLELMAIFNGLKAFPFPNHSHILIRTDNTTALSYVNKVGGCRATSCHAIAKSIWQWCEYRKIVIKCCYIPSKLNIIADRLSRCTKDPSDFKLSPSAFSKVVVWFGMPTIDLFASNRTKQCQRFASWLPEPNAIVIDSFTISWKNEFFYAFPPFNQIHKVLRKIKDEESRGIVVVPDWPTQPWFPLFYEPSVSRILKLRSKNLLFDPYDYRPHPLSKKLGLLAAILSNSNTSH